MRHRGRARADTLLLVALLEGATNEEAAKRAGVAVATVGRRLGDLGFCDRLHDLEMRTLEAAARRMSTLTSKASETHEDAIDPTNPNLNVRLGGAKSVVEMTCLRESNVRRFRLDRADDEPTREDFNRYTDPLTRIAMKFVTTPEP